MYDHSISRDLENISFSIIYVKRTSFFNFTCFLSKRHRLWMVRLHQCIYCCKIIIYSIDRNYYRMIYEPFTIWKSVAFTSSNYRTHTLSQIPFHLIQKASLSEAGSTTTSSYTDKLAKLTPTTLTSARSSLGYHPRIYCQPKPQH